MTALQKKELYIALIAGLIAIISPFSSDSYTPSLPVITHALGSTTNHMQLTMTLYVLGAAFAQLIYGPLSDRFGRKIIVIIGLSICVFGSFLCASATSANALILSRLVQGMGAGACNGLFRSIMRDSFSGARLAQVGSYIGIAYPVVYALAPILGAYVQHLWGWRESFMVAGGVLTVVLLLVLCLLPETHHSRDEFSLQPIKILKKYFSLLIHPIFMGYTLLASLTFSGFICYYTSAPFLLQELAGMSVVQFGWTSIFISIGIIVSQYLNSHFVMKKGIRGMMIYGIYAMMIAGVSMFIPACFHIINAWVIVGPSVIFSIATGFVFANAMAGAFEPFGHMAGIAGAMYGFLQMMGGVLTTFLLANVVEDSQMPLGIIFAALGFMAWLVFYLLGRYARTSI